MRKFLPISSMQSFPIRILPSLVKAFLVFLPWSVLFSVFLTHKLGIPGASLIKELLLSAVIAVVALHYVQTRTRPKFDVLDVLVAAYVAWMVLSTAVNGGGFAHYAYGGRYDFEFLAAFLAFKHARPLLSGTLSSYVVPFLKSAGAAILAGVFVRFVLGEEILLHFGFSANLSNWQFGGSVPIYHGIDQANVRRFQGIFDGPNPAAFFLIVYGGLFAHYFRTRKDDAFFVGTVLSILLFLVLYTYSRSSLVGLVMGIGLAALFSAKTIWTKHRKSLAIAIPLLAVLMGAFYLRFENTIGRIVLREGSSNGHFERMYLGVERFRASPVFGEGLATSGPGYRYVVPELRSPDLSDERRKEIEDRSIPESWYVQQLVEGGLPALVLLAAVLFVTGFRLYAFSVPFFAAFVAACSMNLFLHTFESAYASLALFAFAGLFVAKVPRSERSSRTS